MNSNQSLAKLTCAACGKSFRWRKELAGRTVRCKCGQKMTAPDQPDASDSAAPASSASENTVKPEAPAPLGGLWTQALSAKASVVETALEQREDDAKPEVFKDKYLPGAMIVLGVAGVTAAWIVMGSVQGSLSVGKSMLGAGLILASQVLIFLPLATASAFFVARLTETAFGDLPTTVFKLAAILLFAGAASDSVFFTMLVGQEFDFRVFFVGFALYTGSFGLLLWRLFDTDFHESMVFVVLLMTPRLFTAVLVLPFAKELFTS